MSKKVIVLALENIQNVGDELLGISTQYLTRSVSAFPVERRQFTLSVRQALKQGNIVGGWLFILLRGVAIIFDKIHFPNVSFYFNKYAYYCKLRSYYERIMKKASAIILAIGMLKYMTQNFSCVFDEVTKCATKYNIPVLFNAQSIQKKNMQDPRYRSLVKACNRPCVKAIKNFLRNI